MRRNAGVYSKIMRWLPDALGLLIAALVAWWTCPVPRLPTLTFVAMVWIALRYTIVVSLTAAVATALATALARRKLFDRTVLRTATAAAWLAPLFAFLASRSIWAAVAAIALAIAITRLAPIPYTPERPGKMLLYSFSAALLVQTAIIAAFAGPSLGSTLLAGACAAAVAWTIQANRWRIAPARSSTRDSRGLAFAMLLTLFALAPFLKPDLHDVADPTAIAPSTTTQSTPNSQPAFAGVILWPELPPQPMVVPPARTWLHDPLQPVRTDPLSIPFFGVYWLYRAPSTEPPPNSIVERGTPAEHIFRSTDFRPLAMEARQNFGRFIDVSCCRAIQIAIRNEDAQPGTVWLDVFLADSSIALLPTQYLGRQPVERGHDLLTFPFTRTFRHTRFDEIRIRYELDGSRARRSANVAIDRFVFVPR